MRARARACARACVCKCVCVCVAGQVCDHPYLLPGVDPMETDERLVTNPARHTHARARARVLAS